MIEKLESITVTKRTITRVFKIAVALVVAGSAGSIAVIIWALVNGAVAFGGPQVVTVDAGPVAGALVALAVASVLTGIGAAAAVIAWAGALLNTARLEDKSWFTALLGLGLVSLGWVALIAYVLYGPDGSQPAADIAA